MNATRRRSGGTSVMGVPSMSRSPAEAVSTPATSRHRVDFPAPDGPVITQDLARPHLDAQASSSARVSANALASRGAAAGLRHPPPWCPAFYSAEHGRALARIEQVELVRGEPDAEPGPLPSRRRQAPRRRRSPHRAGATSQRRGPGRDGSARCRRHLAVRGRRPIPRARAPPPPRRPGGAADVLGGRRRSRCWWGSTARRRAASAGRQAAPASPCPRPPGSPRGPGACPAGGSSAARRRTGRRRDWRGGRRSLWAGPTC